MKRRKTRQLKIDCVLCSRHCSQNKRLRASSLSLSLSLLRTRSRHSTSPSLSLRPFSARTPPFRRSRRSSSFREIRYCRVEKSLKRRRRRSLTRLFETTTTTKKKTRNDQSKTERRQNELLNETSTKGSVPRVHSQRSRGVV